MKKLESETIYTIGKFNIILNEDTGDLKVSVNDSTKSLQVQPKSDNSIIIHARRQ